MKQQWQSRLFLLLVIFFALAVIIVGRLFYLQVVRYQFFLGKSLEQRAGIITLAAPRGDIFDTKGELLATSINSYSLFAVPKEIEDKRKMARELAPVLRMRRGEILKKLQRHPTFVWLKRKQDRLVAEKVEKKGLKGIYYLIEKKRVYPKGPLAASVLGFVGIDNNGLAGVEVSCDEFLKGKEGKLLTERDPSGYQIISASQKILESPLEGINVTLTLDEVIQYYAEKALSKAVEKFKAKQGIALVMDPRTGEILAAACEPSFDPNYYYKFPKERWQSKIASFVYEPGSTFKVITVAAALESGVVDLDTKLKAVDKIEVGGRVIENSHKMEWDGRYITISKMLEDSINTGAVQLGLKMGKDRFYKQIKKFGFGNFMAVRLPGVSRGIVNAPRYWYKPDIAMIAFGQSIAVTPLQLLSAIAAVANDGKQMKPFLVKKIESLDKSYVKVFAGGEIGTPLSSKVANQTKKLMEKVVTDGTGKLARLRDFRVAGKTGTAQKIIEGGRGYLKGHYIASFIGFAPVKDPRIAILVIVDDPQGSYWGATVAGPAFREIAENSLRYLNVPPDKERKL